MLRLVCRNRRTFSQLSKYNARAIESKWQASWQIQTSGQGVQSPSPFAKLIPSTKQDTAPGEGEASHKEEEFVMVFPPPNVTGQLHCGHALTTTIQDALVRFHQMQGRPVRWIPGTDHAGIATQSIVERHLAKTGEKSRKELGRDAFVSRVWEWKKAQGDHIVEQLRSLGTHFAWADQFFTLDAPRSRIVRDAFVELYRRGLIYRDTRLVHWCCALQTAISDMEVDYISVEKPTDRPIAGNSGASGATVRVGVLHHFMYKVHPEDVPSAGLDSIEVATTRIETMLGDTAVAVHPDDQRYATIVGKRLIHPLVPSREVIVIADEAVDPNFGTGAVKITPAHDPNDHAMGKRHNLPSVDLLDDLGRLQPACGLPDLSGVDRLEARPCVVALLQAAGSYVREEPHTMRLAVCSRSGDLIEPRVVPQWYVKCGPMARKVLDKIAAGEMTFADPAARVEMEQCLENMRDWCISRQLWWGHRIPAFRYPEGNNEAWIASKESPEGGASMQQDNDVLDTWFSSALLPISATNPDVDVAAPSDLINYPTSLLETGQDILFFWVARMAMLCTELTGEVPFRQVLLHGMVRDAQGRKMSKSLGNVIDPMHIIEGRSLQDLIDDLQRGNLPAQEVERSRLLLKKALPHGIPQCGADALRLTLLGFAGAKQINLDVNKVQSNHHFANKVYNIAKFAAPHVDHTMKSTIARADEPIDSSSLSLVDTWLLWRLAALQRSWVSAFRDMHPAKATQNLTAFILEDLSDVYIEMMKRRLAANDSSRAALAYALQQSLAMLYPVMPHLACELHSVLYAGHAAISPPLSGDELAQKAEATEGAMRDVLEIVRAGRKLAGDQHTDRQTLLVHLPILHDSEIESALKAAVADLGSYIARLARFREIHVEALSKETESERDETGFATIVIHGRLRVSAATLTREGGDSADAGNAKHAARLAQEIERLQLMMGSPSYETTVPEAIRRRNANKLDSFRERLAALTNP